MPIVAYLCFFNDTATTEIYTLSLHDALPISRVRALHGGAGAGRRGQGPRTRRVDRFVGVVAERDEPVAHHPVDRQSTRLNSSHANISYAVFCLQKKYSRASALSHHVRFRDMH